ncbi:Transposon Tf2-6 polyprotein [Sparassis crispa]|uniref:RNA-directed DNA polymerase n=1 Tax=Sparassis crispa TaxID=139825 RepID=A0A401G4X3_9APHY|nr:Transposon Tf2-6 polyprotein [Sparassis crispa]GBE77221.1 Transposon Tf2-6 polyprotein [Sparassis crispa]
MFMNIRFAEENDFIRWELPKPITVMNADGTPNQMGTITHCTWKMMKIGGRKTLTRFLLTGIGKENILLGMPWLKRLNPMINWETGDFWFGKDAKWPPKPTVEDAPDEEVSIFKGDGLPELITTETSPTSFGHSESIREIMTDNTERGELPAVRNDTELDDLPSESPMDQLDDDDLVISYIAGEPVIGIFEPIRKESPLTNEETETAVFTIRRGPAIGRMTHSTRSPLFCNAQNTVFYKPSGKSQELAQQAHKEASAVDKPKTVEELVPNYLHDLKSVFEKKAAERFPETRPWDHAIDLKPDFIPRDCKVYPLLLKEQGAMDDFLEENLRKGYIRPSKSPMASPFFFVGKKDGALRPCQDYRYLNEGTVKNAYPLPLISDLMDQFKGASIFTKMDLRSEYNNVRIKDGDQWKGAFKTNRGLFEPMVMFFRLCNSPATFQMMMNALFKDMIDEGWIVIYMDDILIFSNDLEEHHVRTRHVLQRLKDNDLFLKPEKCFFDVKEVEFLGMIIRENYIGMDPIKLKGIAEWPEPSTVKGVRSFLGFGNFYRKFIANFSDIAKPLTNLTRTAAGSPPFEWTTGCQTAFDTLKQRFSTAPVLLLPDKAKPFIVESDASKFATGAVLRQADINGDLHPCAYISQTLNPAERNYEIYDRELLGIIRALTEWRHYLEGSPHPVEVRSDHKNLTYFRTAQKLNRRQARWSLKLSQFDLHLIHVPGTQMIQSDALSRRNGLDDSESDNEDRVLLPNTLFVRSISPTLFDEIRNHAAKDLIVHEALEAIAHKGPFPMKSSLSDWEVRDGVILYKGKIYVPPSETLRRDLVRLHHDSPAMGHPGKFNTLELLRREFWWPGMYTFVYNYVEGCAACQQMKPNTHPTRIPLEPIPADPHALPFSCCTTDFITDLPISNGFDSIMVVVDHDLTKGVILTPCLKTITAEGTAKIFHDKVYSRFGLPDRIISDRGPQYASKVFQELNRLLQIRSSMSTAYHPQTDGETERVNQELEIYLRLYCGNNPETWADRLPDLEFCHNTREHSARKMSPFRIMMGYEPRGLPSVFPSTNIPSVESRLDMLQKIRLEALAMHELARQQMADRVRQGSPKFTLGQKVWLDSRNLKVNYASRKIAPKREGPFEIVEVIGPANYRLKLLKTWRVHSVFHAALLSPYRENDIHGPNYMNPPPDVVDNEEEYEVEAILNHKMYRGHLRYLVKWKGYSSAENSWEPTHNLQNAKRILDAYKRTRGIQ